MPLSTYSDDTLLASDDSDDELLYKVNSRQGGWQRQSFHLSDHLYRLLPRTITRPLHLHRRHNGHPYSHSLYSRRIRRIFFLIKFILVGLITLILFTAIFRPSYTHKPKHYRALETQSQLHPDGGANPFNEKVFIAVSLYDKEGHLTGGRWGESVLELIDLLGRDNVFLSIYQSDSGNGTSLEAFKEKVKCKNEIVNDLAVSKNDFPTVTTPDGSDHVKRVLYLAEMRNRALRPLDQAGPTKYDKILFLNDISFHPLDAAHLLFSTNVDSHGKAQYLAACALDYSNPFKFYDLFVTRDNEGFSMGLPFFPIFSAASKGESRKDILAQKDAVRVKSCWSGMVAARAHYIQSSSPSTPEGFQNIGAHIINPKAPRKVTTPVRFRAEPELFFDACECCLFLADLLQVAKNAHDDLGVFINPFIRVAYSSDVLSWLLVTRRFERLFSWPHRLAMAFTHLPTFNPHRTVSEGETFNEEVWVNDGSLQDNGTWRFEKREARNGMHCGVREMQVLHQGPRTEDTNWFYWPIPEGQKLFFPT
jgi:hypothetical protein